MKILKFFAFALIIYTSGHGQDKKDSSFIINEKINKEVLISALIEHDNFIEDEKYNVITTKPRNSSTRPGWSYLYYYEIVIKESTTVIKPFWSTGVGLKIGVATADAQYSKWKARTKGNNINAFIYKETLAVLEEAGYTNITYQ